MKSESALDVDKLVQLRLCIHNACLIAAIFVTVQESLTRLSKLLNQISYSINLKESMQYLQNQSGFLNIIAHALQLPAADSMGAADRGSQLMNELLLTPEWKSKIKHYVTNITADNYRSLLLIVPLITSMGSANKILDATLLTIKIDLERLQNDVEKNKAALAINLIAQAKSEMSYLQNAFNEMLSNYYY